MVIPNYDELKIKLFEYAYNSLVGGHLGCNKTLDIF